MDFQLSPNGEIRIADLFPGIITPCIIHFEKIEGDLHLKTYDNVGYHSDGLPPDIKRIEILDKTLFFMSNNGCTVTCYL